MDEERYDVEAKVTKNITEVGILGKSGHPHSRLSFPGLWLQASGYGCLGLRELGAENS